jgi:uncharacterized protein (DUF486 family)
MRPLLAAQGSNVHIAGIASEANDVPPAHRGTLRGLDWLNFFLADVQTGVGPFLAVYLAAYGGNEERVGLALTVGGIAGILTQTPAGALVDYIHSWGIALFEYCLAVPANRLGFVQFSGFQLKIIQEVITISMFIVFAIFFLKEKLAWNYLVAFAFLGVAAFFAFAFKAPGSVV